MPVLLIRVRGFTTVKVFETRDELEKWAHSFMTATGEDFVVPFSGPVIYRGDTVELLIGG